LVAENWRCKHGRLAHDWFYSHRWVKGDTGKHGSKFVPVLKQTRLARRQMQLEKRLVCAVNDILDERMKKDPQFHYHGFYDQDCLPAGENFEVGFVEALEHSKVVILALSQTSVDTIQSNTADKRQDNVLVEIEAGLDMNSRTQGEFALMPLRLTTIKKGELKTIKKGKDEVLEDYRQTPLNTDNEFAGIQDEGLRLKAIQEAAEADEGHQEWENPGYFGAGNRYVNEDHNGGLGLNVHKTMTKVGKLVWTPEDIVHLGNYKKVAERIVAKIDQVDKARARFRRGR
jgi:hypothetical protein